MNDFNDIDFNDIDMKNSYIDFYTFINFQNSWYVELDPQSIEIFRNTILNSNEENQNREKEISRIKIEVDRTSYLNKEYHSLKRTCSFEDISNNNEFNNYLKQLIKQNKLLITNVNELNEEDIKGIKQDKSLYVSSEGFDKNIFDTWIEQTDKLYKYNFYNQEPNKHENMKSYPIIPSSIYIKTNTNQSFILQMNEIDMKTSYIEYLDSDKKQNIIHLRQIFNELAPPNHIKHRVSLLRSTFNLDKSIEFLIPLKKFVQQSSYIAFLNTTTAIQTCTKPLENHYVEYDKTKDKYSFSTIDNPPQSKQKNPEPTPIDAKNDAPIKRQLLTNLSYICIVMTNGKRILYYNSSCNVNLGLANVNGGSLRLFLDKPVKVEKLSGHGRTLFVKIDKLGFFKFSELKKLEKQLDAKSKIVVTKYLERYLK